jgi:hypothetical protein
MPNSKAMKNRLTLYHGTSSAKLDSILKSGLKPQHKSNWDGLIASKSGLVYLSDAYPLYFAQQACSVHGGNPAVIRVELPPNHPLYPDEDWVARQLHRQGEYTNFSLDKLTFMVDPTELADHWQDSLKASGNVAAREIPPHMITGYVVIEEKDLGWTLSLGADATPTEMNHMFLGQAYIKALEVLFETNSPEQAVEAWQRTVYPEEVMEEMAAMRERVEAMKQ